MVEISYALSIPPKGLPVGEIIPTLTLQHRPMNRTKPPLADFGFLALVTKPIIYLVNV